TPEHMHVHNTGGINHSLNVRNDPPGHADVHASCADGAQWRREAVLHVDDQQRGQVGVDVKGDWNGRHTTVCQAPHDTPEALPGRTSAANEWKVDPETAERSTRAAHLPHGTRAVCGRSRRGSQPGHWLAR